MCRHETLPDGTFIREEVVIPGPDGKKICVDQCLAPLITALNQAGLKTAACCCGHGRCFGSVMLKDGRELLIIPDRETAQTITTQFSRPLHYKSWEDLSYDRP